MTGREKLVDQGYEDVILFDAPDFDNSIIGVTTENRAVYDYDMMVDEMSKRDGMSEDEAAEFIDFNSVRAAEYMSDGPIVMYRLERDDE